MARSPFMIPAFLIVAVLWFAGVSTASETWHYVLWTVLCMIPAVAVSLQVKGERK